MPTVTEELLALGQSEKGGWTRVQLSAIGVTWPPARGWKTKVIGTEISDENLAAFLGSSPPPKCHEPAVSPQVTFTAPISSSPQPTPGVELNALRAVVNPLYRSLRWPTQAEESAYLRARRDENLARSLKNSNENWMLCRLGDFEAIGHWRRQYLWGYRVFDFFDSSRGVAIEVDGREHDSRYDSYRDVHNFLRSGVVVLRVRNRNEADAEAAVAASNRMNPWRLRRKTLGETLVHRKHLVVLWRAGLLNGEQLLADTIATGRVPDSFDAYTTF